MNKNILSCFLFACLSCCLLSFTTPRQVQEGEYLDFKVTDVQRMPDNQRRDVLHAVAKIKNISTQPVEFGMFQETRHKTKAAYGFAYSLGDGAHGTRGLPIDTLRLEPQESVFVSWSIPISKKIPSSDIDSFTYSFNYLCVGETVLSDDKLLRLRAPAQVEDISSMDTILEQKFLFNLKTKLVQQEGKDFLHIQALSGHSAHCITSLLLKREGDTLQLIPTTRPVFLAPEEARGDFRCTIALPAEVKRLVVGLQKETIWQR